MRIATIRVRSDTDQGSSEMRAQFLAAWKTGEYQGEVFEFESPAALFRLLTPKRWELLVTLQDAKRFSSNPSDFERALHFE